MTPENFVRIVWTVLEKIGKSRKLAVFGLFLAMFLTFQSYDFDAFEHAGAPLGVEWLQNFMKIVWTVFENFEVFIKRSGEEKRHDWTPKKFFPTPKNQKEII